MSPDSSPKACASKSYAVDIAADGEQALYQASINAYDLVILDVMLPAKTAITFAANCAPRGFRAPILMLTARDAVDDRVAGLDAGADDYLVKPFDFKELLARLRALSRRSGDCRPAGAAGRRPDPRYRQPCRPRAGRPINLTAKEYALLEFLVLNQGRVVGREQSPNTSGTRVSTLLQRD